MLIHRQYQRHTLYTIKFFVFVQSRSPYFVFCLFFFSTNVYIFNSLNATELNTSTPHVGIFFIKFI